MTGNPKLKTKGGPQKVVSGLEKNEREEVPNRVRRRLYSKPSRKKRRIKNQEKGGPRALQFVLKNGRRKQKKKATNHSQEP